MNEDGLQFIGKVIDELLDRGFVFSSPWLTPKQAAKYCQLSESYLASLRSQGIGPVLHPVGPPKKCNKGKNKGKQHNLIRYHRDDLDRWLMNGMGQNGGS